MRPTVSTSVSDLSVKTDDKTQLEYFVNRELRPALKEVRIGLNAIGTERPPVVASDGAGTYVTIWTSAALPNDGAWLVQAYVAGVGLTQRAAYWTAQAFVSVGGTCSMPGTQAFSFTYESNAACDALFSVDAPNRVAILKVRDAGTEAMTWTAVVRTHEGTS